MRIFCVGAGGSGMAAIVQWHLALRDEVFIIDDIVPADALLRQYPGAVAWDIAKNVLPDRIVFSDAIPAEHALRAYAKQHGIRETSFPEELGALCKGHRVIAVTGTHGKSTTTALLSWTLTSAGKDPLCFIGAEIPTWNGNFRWGDGPIVVEADEYRKHFLVLHPETVVIASLEMDHFDTYPDAPALLATFTEFCAQPSVRRILIARGKPMLEDLARALAAKGISTSRFGAAGDFVSVDDVRYENGICSAALTVAGHSETITYPAVTCPHVSNLAGVVAVLATENISPTEVQKGIASFPGICRRMERIGLLGNVPVYSDYAHHSTAVQETLAIVKRIWPADQIAVLFEPHERLRTSRLCGEYAGAFAAADVVGLLPVYDPVGRERKDIEDAACQITGDAITPLVGYDAGFAWMQKFARDSSSHEAIVIIMGAGPIDSQIRKRMTSAQL